MRVGSAHGIQQGLHLIMGRKMEVAQNTVCYGIGFGLAIAAVVYTGQHEDDPIKLVAVESYAGADYSSGLFKMDAETYEKLAGQAGSDFVACSSSCDDGDKTPFLVHKSAWCDSNLDCPNGEDEKMCAKCWKSKNCDDPHGLFVTSSDGLRVSANENSGRVVVPVSTAPQKDKVPDSWIYCKDIHEKSAVYRSLTDDSLTDNPALTQVKNAFVADDDPDHSGGWMVSKHLVCDGRPICTNGEDEPETCVKYACKTAQGNVMEFYENQMTGFYKTASYCVGDLKRTSGTAFTGHPVSASSLHLLDRWADWDLNSLIRDHGKAPLDSVASGSQAQALIDGSSFHVASKSAYTVTMHEVNMDKKCSMPKSLQQGVVDFASLSTKQQMNSDFSNGVCSEFQYVSMGQDAEEENSGFVNFNKKTRDQEQIGEDETHVDAAAIGRPKFQSGYNDQNAWGYSPEQTGEASVITANARVHACCAYMTKQDIDDLQDADFANGERRGICAGMKYTESVFKPKDGKPAVCKTTAPSPALTETTASERLEEAWGKVKTSIQTTYDNYNENGDGCVEYAFGDDEDSDEQKKYVQNFKHDIYLMQGQCDKLITGHEGTTYEAAKKLLTDTCIDGFAENEVPTSVDDKICTKCGVAVNLGSGTPGIGDAVTVKDITSTGLGADANDLFKRIVKAAAIGAVQENDERQDNIYVITTKDACCANDVRKDWYAYESLVGEDTGDGKFEGVDTSKYLTEDKAYAIEKPVSAVDQAIGVTYRYEIVDDKISKSFCTKLASKICSDTSVNSLHNPFKVSDVDKKTRLRRAHTETAQQKAATANNKIPDCVQKNIKIASKANDYDEGMFIATILLVIWGVMYGVLIVYAERNSMDTPFVHFVAGGLIFGSFLTAGYVAVASGITHAELKQFDTSEACNFRGAHVSVNDFKKHLSDLCILTSVACGMFGVQLIFYAMGKGEGQRFQTRGFSALTSSVL